MVEIVSRCSPGLRIVAAVVALSLGLPVSADAQGEGASGLQPPDAVLEADPSAGTGFSMVTSVRELPDARVLVADWQENRLAAVDMESGETMDLVRIGEGPGEFGRVGWVYELGDELSLVTDAMSRRWSIFDGTEVMRTIPASEPLPIGLGPMLSGIDRSGSVLGTRVHPRPPVVRRREADTLVLLLGHLDDSRIDTLATLQGPSRFPGARVMRAGRMRPVTHPLRTEEQARLFLDGWIAVARTDPYRVDWRSPEGRWTLGDPLPRTPLPVDDREKCFATQRLLNGTATCDLIDEFAWPDTLPAYLLYDIGAHTARGTPTLLAAPDGRLLVRRSESAEVPGTRYDVIDRQGERVDVIALPGNEAIVGFGADSVYTIATSELGLQTLRRHPWS